MRFLGCSQEAARLRKLYAEALSKELESVSGSNLNWDIVADIMKRVAFKVVGPTPARAKRPWLQGKEAELLQLESAVHKLEGDLREARRTRPGEVEGLLSSRREANNQLRAAKRRWEACWWDDLAAKANQAGDGGDETAFWQICRQLGFRESYRADTGCVRSCYHPEREREAWKTFLAGIQSGLGEVSESVWEVTPPAQKYVEHLAQPSSRHEFDCALSKMKFGKRGGEDDVTVELIRFGNTDLKDVVFQVVLDMWTEASSADEGREASSWCSSSRSGVCIPMFKNKGSRSDKSNYRNLVMLSVSAKLVARMAASRLGKWVEEWLPDEQNGFCPRRGIDDVQQFVRRLLEEVSVSAKSGDIGFTCFDIVRAYTRVCRVALWQLLSRLGVPSAFIKILKALHEHTQFRVFVHNGYSSAWFTDRGLREGCPSSPVLFSIFHHAIMVTFRSRREAQAVTAGRNPGVPWAFKVDGHITRTGNARHSSRGVRSEVVGDIKFADDTALFGWLDELCDAEKLFVQTLLDWGQEEHAGKREKLILLSQGRLPMDVLNQFESRTLKHLGALHSDNADQWPETKKRVQAGFYAVKRVAKYWSLGTNRGWGNQAGLNNSRKLRVMRCVLEGTLLACGKSRVWSLAQGKKANQVLARGIRRSLGLDRFNVREFGYSDEDLRQMVQWDHFTPLLRRNVLKWLGHVARMDCGRIPKMAVFGWPHGLEEHRSGRYTFPMWVRWMMTKYDIPVMDWFRLAQNPLGIGSRLLTMSCHAPAYQPNKF